VDLLSGTLSEEDSFYLLYLRDGIAALMRAPDSRSIDASVAHFASGMPRKHILFLPEMMKEKF
jgi:hypothetical protein